MVLGSPGEFGYPERTWRNFAGGDMLIAAIGEHEVRYRLQVQHPTALQIGRAAECAERLLLLKLGVRSGQDLLAAPGGQWSVLSRRLEAVGLSDNGSVAECAERLLLLLDTPVAALGDEHLAGEDYDDLPPLIPLPTETDNDDLPPLPPLQSETD